MKIIVNESQFKKLILKEGNNTTGNTTNDLHVELTDKHSKDFLKKIAHNDKKVISHLQQEIDNELHTKHNSNFMDTLNHNLHAHYDFKNNHLKLEFPHLGKHHDIEIDIEASFGHHDSHDNEPINLVLEPNFGATFKIPLHFHSKH